MPQDWGYSESNGPDTWYKLFPSAAGSNQSPVDIPTAAKHLTAKRKLHWKYQSDYSTELHNASHSWRVVFTRDDSLLTGGPLEDDYTLKQVHCHWGASNEDGSEHAIEGKKYAAELHFVHWNKEKYSNYEEAMKHPGGLCVVAVFLKIGKQNAELEKIVELLNVIAHKGEKTFMNTYLNFDQLLPHNSGYYTYNGSLTTPPCLETVIWIIFKNPVQISRCQLDAFRNIKNHTKMEQCLMHDCDGYVKSNIRPMRPLNERDIREMSK